MSAMPELIELFISGKNVDICASQKLVYNLQAIITIANAYIEDYTGPGGYEIAPMETVRALAIKCLTEEVTVAKT